MEDTNADAILKDAIRNAVIAAGVENVDWTKIPIWARDAKFYEELAKSYIWPEWDTSPVAYFWPNIAVVNPHLKHPLQP